MQLETLEDERLITFKPDKLCWLTDTADKNVVGYVTEEGIANRIAVLLSKVGDIEIGTLDHVGYEYIWYIRMTNYGPFKNMDKARGFFHGYCFDRE